MGKKRGRREPRWMATRKPPPPPSPPSLRLSIVVSPTSAQGSISLRKEVELVRAAALFADHIEIVSPVAELLGGMTAAFYASDTASVELLLSLDDSTVKHLGWANLPPNWRDLLRRALRKHDAATGPGRDAMESFREMAMTTTQSLRDTAAELVVNAGGEELLAALHTGVVSLRPMFSEGDANSADFAQAYTRELEELLQDGRRHLLLDDFTTSMARHLLEEGSVQPASRATPNAWEATLGTGMIARLPSFHAAPLDELLNVRRDLDGPLARYRRAVATLGEKVHTSPFAVDAPLEVDHLYRTSVLPALTEIREELAHHSFVREYARTLGENPATFLTGLSATGALVVLATAVPDVAALAAAAGLVSPATTASTRRQEALREIKKNDLFYLHEVNRRLT